MHIVGARLQSSIKSAMQVVHWFERAIVTEKLNNYYGIKQIQYDLIR